MAILASPRVGLTEDPRSQRAPWAVYYARSAPIAELLRYRLLVLDNENHGPLAPLLDGDRVVLGYLSIGEVGNHRSYFSKARKQGVLLGENPNWRGSYMVDLRKRAWRRRVVDDLVPSILAQGFTGIFLDTLDNAGHLERTDPERFHGMRRAAVELVAEIRQRYPRALIMMNRGYDLIDQMAPHLDMVLGESVYTSYDFERKRYRFVPESLYREQLRILEKARMKFPRLGVYTLDYWDAKDSEGRRAIYDEERRNGFTPYVATIQLDRIVEE